MQELAQESNFLGLTDPKHFGYDTAAVVIQSLPYEHSSSYHLGSKLGPEAILKASHYVEFYDIELDKEICFDHGICTLEPMDFNDAIGEEAMALIQQHSAKIIDDQKFLVSLGAEHTVSYGVIKAVSKKYTDLSILQIDAHSDLRQEYEGSKWSHASVMARVSELGLPITQVGIRAQCKEEAEIIRSNEQINTFYAHQIDEDDQWMRKAADSLSENVYITIDADGFDPSIMPAVGTPEPNGLKWNETIAFFKRIFADKNVVAFDIVECAPRKIDTRTEYNLAQLAYKLIGLKFK